MEAPSNDTKRCIKCHSVKPLTEFKKRTQKGKNKDAGESEEITKKCASCMELEAKWTREKRKRTREEAEEVGDIQEDVWRLDLDSPVRQWDDFANEAREGSKKEQMRLKLASRVETGTFAPVGTPDDIEGRAKIIAAQIGDVTLWRWKYVVILTSEFITF